MNSIAVFTIVLAMAALSTAAIRTDVRARYNSNKVVSGDQLSIFGEFITGNEVYLTKNNWFNFTIYTEHKNLDIGMKYLVPQPNYSKISIKVLNTTAEVLEKSDPNIMWFLPPTLWYATVGEGPVRESVNVNAFIPQAALMGLYHLTVSAANEHHVNTTNLFVQETGMLH